tara:strand:+ start:8177 stop:8944 length:768 start_codon:yes stop_codon:yes gene_type:complete
MRFPWLLEPIAKTLRGKYGSIRRRFWHMPIGRLKLNFFYFKGGTWIEFYANMLDGYAARNIEKLPAEDYLQEGKQFRDWLIDHGLKPEHRLLDYGCGVLRAGRYLIPYLNRGHYVGIDISKNRIRKGHLVLSSAGISRDDYEVHLTKDCLLKELKNQRFDVVWANSVLTHMPEQDIRLFLRALKSHFKQGGTFFFTFSPSERLSLTIPKQEKIKNFYYPTNYLKNLFKECGYNFELLHDGHAEKYKSPTVRASVM